MQGRINWPYSAVSIGKGVPDGQEIKVTLGFAENVEKNQPGIAFSLYASVVNASVLAQYKCGHMLMNGIGVAQDVPLARVYLETAATNGSLEAKEELAKYPVANSNPALLSSFSLSSTTLGENFNPKLDSLASSKANLGPGSSIVSVTPIVAGAAVRYTFIQAGNKVEYVEVKKILKETRRFLKVLEKFNEIFVFEEKNLRVYLTKTQEELSQLYSQYQCPIDDYHFHGWFPNGNYHKIELQLTDECQEKSPDECRRLNRSMERRRQEKEAREIEKKRSTLNFRNIIIDKPHFQQYQIIVVQDNHDTVDAQKWIAEYFENQGKKTNTWLLVEFCSKNESDPEEIKKYVTRLLLFASFNSKEVNPATRIMLEKAFEYGFLRGCENTASMEINQLMMSRGQQDDLLEKRKSFFDASCAQEINKILQQDPTAKILVWSGSAHADGVTKNMLSLEGRNLKNITIYPGSENPASTTELVGERIHHI